MAEDPRPRWALRTNHANHNTYKEVRMDHLGQDESSDANISQHRRKFLQTQLAAGFAVAIQPGATLLAGTEETPSSVRNVTRITKSKPKREGAGVHLHRAFGFGDTKRHDPFLLLDDFRNDDPRRYRKGFPWHPHRGIETISYVMAGSVTHSDSLGNEGTLGPNDVQWMTAGSGILHQEMPRGDAQGRMHGFQLWGNLPKKLKMSPPRYQDVRAAEIPVVKDDDGTTARIVCGEFWGQTGPANSVAAYQPRFLDVYLPPNTSRSLPVQTSHHAFAYVFGGSVRFHGASKPRSIRVEHLAQHGSSMAQFTGNRSLVLFDQGDAIQVESSELGARFLLVSGEPFREPVAWKGPIVMNTQQELNQAWSEMRKGTFIKNKGSQ